jgi:hypothetical protein
MYFNTKSYLKINHNYTAKNSGRTVALIVTLLVDYLNQFILIN